MEQNTNYKDIIDFYENRDTQFLLKQFLVQIQSYFSDNPKLTSGDFPIIHSTKYRFKNPKHLEDKINRKAEKNCIITKENLFTEITDLIGVRVLYLYKDQFRTIHDEILKKVEQDKDWIFVENPKAYTWDPESKKYYESLQIGTELRDTYYTSVHYIVKLNNNSNPVCCEIQVRTLFEEIWGEIDHTINYPYPTKDIACKEQLRVLSKLVATGTRLNDSIFKCYQQNKQ